jgi:mannose-1-phosphate guanylyltransferase/mannose-6-phosphate isomerase
MPETIRPVILCGGAGTRLWPASRDSLPKQFLKLLGPQSTLQETVARVSDPAIFGRPVVVTNRDYRFLVREQLEEIGVAAEILLEPARRDSGPAVAAATAHIAQRRRRRSCWCCRRPRRARPAAFVAACRDARQAAEAGHIVTFGLEPDHPATAYGYIRPGPPVPNAPPARAVEAFVEKPDAPTAERYVKDGYLWNSGNFLFRADVLLAEYSAFDPASAETVARAVKNATDDLGFRLLDEAAFAAAEKKSVDYAVMEKTRRAAVVPAAYGWSDVGGWNAVWELLPQDANRNAADGQVVFLDTSGSYVLSRGRLAALVGVKDLVVIVEDDAVLVADRSRSEDLRRLVERLRKEGRSEADTHARIYRPWGFYQNIDRGERFHVKRIVVKPGARVSLQKHMHRSEHWVVVRGTARVTIGDQVTDVHENEAAYIPINALHRMENPGKIPLELIEVQSGSNLAEDDIVRVEDDYRRAKKD